MPSIRYHVAQILATVQTHSNSVSLLPQSVHPFMTNRTPLRSSLQTPVLTRVLDAHIHLFDPTRPGGIPWPVPEDSILYHPALPARYAAIAQPHGIVAAIAVEASPRPADNHWLLEIARQHPLIVGVVANLDPAAPDFLSQLSLLRSDPLCVGIRSGNLWQRDLFDDLTRPATLAHLHALADARLALDTANPDLRLLQAVVTIAHRIPHLRIVLDHLPAAAVASSGNDTLWPLLRDLAQNPNIYAKLSELPRRIQGVVSRDPDDYRPTLDALCTVFDEDHILFGSDWPNSDQWLSYADTFDLVREYFASKSAPTREKFFWHNALQAYRWRPRLPEQHCPILTL